MSLRVDMCRFGESYISHFILSSVSMPSQSQIGRRYSSIGTSSSEPVPLNIVDRNRLMTVCTSSPYSRFFRIVLRIFPSSKYS
jgi:hypothetical protein